jgi:hypothetical protein
LYAYEIHVPFHDIFFHSLIILSFDINFITNFYITYCIFTHSRREYIRLCFSLRYFNILFLCFCFRYFNILFLCFCFSIRNFNGGSVNFAQAIKLGRPKAFNNTTKIHQIPQQLSGYNFCIFNTISPTFTALSGP